MNTQNGHVLVLTLVLLTLLSSLLSSHLLRDVYQHQLVAGLHQRLTLEMRARSEAHGLLPGANPASFVQIRRTIQHPHGLFVFVAFFQIHPQPRLRSRHLEP